MLLKKIVGSLAPGGAAVVDFYNWWHNRCGESDSLLKILQTIRVIADLKRSGFCDVAEFGNFMISRSTRNSIR